MMKKNILMALFGLLLAGCNSGASYPSDPETVLRKGFEALNEKNMKEVNRYFDLQDWDEVLQYKEGMDDDQRLTWRIEKVLKTEYKSVQSNENDMCWISVKVIRSDGLEEDHGYALIKSPSGRWKISGSWSRE